MNKDLKLGIIAVALYVAMTAISFVLAPYLILGSCLSAAKFLLPEHPEGFEDSEANELALSHMQEKYGEEFVIVDTNRPYGYSWEYEGWLIKKSDENLDNPPKYEVYITRNDSGILTVSDTYLDTYYKKIALDFLEPIVAKTMADRSYCVVVTGFSHFHGSSRPIPQNEDDLYEDLKYSSGIQSMYLYIIIPSSEEDDDLPQLTESIKTDLLQTRYEYNGYFAVVSDSDFEKFAQADDPYYIYINRSADLEYFNTSEIIKPDK